MKGPLRLEIIDDMQPYVDDPILANPRADLVSPIACGVRAAFGVRDPQPVTVGHIRVPLHWMKPDGKGGMVER